MSTAKALDIMVHDLTSSLVRGSVPYQDFPKVFGESCSAPADCAVANLPPSKVIPAEDALPFLYPILEVPQQPLLDQIDALAALYGAPESFIAGAICALYWVLDQEINPSPLAEVVDLTKEGT